LKNLRPAPIKIDRPLVTATGCLPGTTVPLVLQPSMDGVNLVHWLASHRDTVSSHLKQHGGVMFRGFGLRGQDDLTACVDALGIAPMHYIEGATPRKQLGEHVYTSTEFPPEHAIALHNELSYVTTWPMRILFLCLTPAAGGGETPVADMRKVHARIPAEIRALFEQRGWMLSRNYRDGFGLTWQTAFRTSSPAEVEDYCAKHRMALEWQDGGRLHTTQVRPATATHPVTGETIWFNHVAFWHSSSLPPDVRRNLLNEYGDHGVPYNTFFGDGSPIDDDIVEQIRQAIDAETVAHPWRSGDLLLLDNMLAAHGRNPFRGERRVLVSMGDPHSRTDW
jgi:alpha-ketoglutarate-dependent taurine dioxygenase